MKLEEQVASLDLSKRLKELGVKQESLYYWLYDPLEGSHFGLCGWFDDQRSPFAAFTVAELGEMLPEDFQCWKWTRGRTLRQEGGEIVWNCLTAGSTTDGHGMVMVASTEADARAKTLVYLIENKLITL